MPNVGAGGEQVCDEVIPSWVHNAMKDARQPEDWQRLGERYQSSLESHTCDVDMPPRLGRRKVRGVYYTPEPLVERLVEATLGPILAPVYQMAAKIRSRNTSYLNQVLGQVTHLRILDPACGTGAFLVVACDRLWQFYRWFNHEMQGKVVDPAIALRQIVGVEIDPVAAEICRRRISEMGTALGCEAVSTQIICADALRLDSLPDANIILTNPPFEVLTNFAAHPQAAATTQWIRRSGKFPLSSRGQINLYRLFLERSIQHLLDGGALGIVLPLSFMGDRQGAALRRALLNDNHLERVTLIAEHQRAFAGATQGVALLVARMGQSPADVTVEQHSDIDGDKAQSRRSVVGINLIRSLSQDLYMLPHCHPKLLPALERMSQHPALAGDDQHVPVAEVHVGELDQTVHRSHISDQPTDVMLVRGEHMGERYVVNLEACGPGRYVSAAFLRAGVASATKSRHRERQRVIFQGIANLRLAHRLRFALCPAGVVLGNSVNYLALHDDEEEQLHYYLGVLNSKLLNWRFCVTSYGNNVGNYEIGLLPIIRYAQAGTAGQEIASLTRRLSRLADLRQMETVEAMELDRRLDRLIYGIYEITEGEQAIIEAER